MTFYGKRHLVENETFDNARKTEALKVYDLIANQDRVLTYLTAHSLNKLAHRAGVSINDTLLALEDLSDLKILDSHAQFTANGDDEDQAVDVPYDTLKRALKRGYFDHPDGRGRLTEKLEEGCSFYFTLEERPVAKDSKKKAVVASTTQQFSLELSLDEFITLCRDAGHKVSDDASISFTEAGSKHRLTLGDSISVRWTATVTKC